MNRPGGTVQTPVKIAGEQYKPMYRLIVDEGETLTNVTDYEEGE